MMLRSLALIMLVMMLQACSISPANIPSDHFYRLASAEVKAEPEKIFDRIQLKPVHVEGLYHERAMLFVEQDRPLEIQRYHYHFWAEPPAQLVHKHVTQHLLSAANTVTEIATEQAVDRVITPEILRFERITGGSEIQLQLTVQFTVHYPAQPQQDWIKVYSLQQPVSSSDMHDTVQAFSVALDQMATNFLVDIRK